MRFCRLKQWLMMMIWGTALAVLTAQPLAVRAADAAASTAPDFKEVYDLLHSHLAGETDADLNRAAVEGLLSQLRTKASLVNGNGTTAAGRTNAAVLARSALHEGPVGYLRVGRVEDGLAGKISAAYKELSQTNQLKGLVIDLRFADGHDYAAATSTADLFVSKEAPLLDWGNGVVRSKAKSDAITIPVAVLVNRDTAAAAEALAGMLRQSARALVLGTNTAGAASIDKEFPLKTGQTLRIATAAIKLGNGEVLGANGISPDIKVAVSPEDEKVYFADPYKDNARPLNLASGAGTTGTNAASTNRSQRPREADLIRERKERPGMELEYSVSASAEREPEKPVIRDPVLGRALDLIKGISVLRAAKPS